MLLVVDRKWRLLLVESLVLENGDCCCWWGVGNQRGQVGSRQLLRSRIEGGEAARVEDEGGEPARGRAEEEVGTGETREGETAREKKSNGRHGCLFKCLNSEIRY